MADLIVELLTRKRSGKLIADEPLFEGDFSPISSSELQIAETQLGFSVTPLLKQIYTEVGNGGFGPSYGLLGLRGGMKNEDGQDAVALYHSYCEFDPEDTLWKWPSRLLPLAHLGCAMYLCVDCTSSEGPIIWFEPNPHEVGNSWADSFIPLADSTENWLLSWLRGEDLFEKLSKT
jgi:hypothetical protein